MRLWSLHPCHLDPQGLVALWREGLLAQKVLQGLTKGYTHHSQLLRFRQQEDPVLVIGSYLRAVVDEADRRGYRFDGSKVVRDGWAGRITVARGQVEYEWEHLLHKLEARSPERYKEQVLLREPRLHPMFRRVAGGIAEWERP